MFGLVSGKWAARPVVNLCGGQQAVRDRNLRLIRLKHANKKIPATGSVRLLRLAILQLRLTGPVSSPEKQI
jgi:hypothetical protein